MKADTASQPVAELAGVGKRFGDKVVLPPLDLAIRPGEFLTLLGPSGCGKTTIIRILAGFTPPDSGVVLIGGRDVTALPPQKRPVNTVFQSYALFPHMTVTENVAFGLRMAGVPEKQARERVDEVLRMVKLTECSERKPFQLSGGQQQRVAIARAVVNRPQVLLLDEPLNALDYRLRKEMQVELKELQRRLGMTFLFVTHDQEEALSMSDRVVVMREGRVEQVGAPREIYEDPANLFVARFVGEANILSGRMTRGTEGAAAEAELEGKRFPVKTTRPLRAGDRVQVVLRPEDLRIRELREDEPSDGALTGHVEERTYKGKTLDSVIVLEGGTRLLASEFFDEDDPSFDYTIGQKVAVSWVPGWEVVLPDEGTGAV